MTVEDRAEAAYESWPGKFGSDDATRAEHDGFLAGYLVGFSDGEEFGWEAKAT